MLWAEPLKQKGFSRKKVPGVTTLQSNSSKPDSYLPQLVQQVLDQEKQYQSLQPGTPEAGADPKTVRTHEPRVYTPANSRGTGSGETLARRHEGNTGTALGRPNLKELSASESKEAHPGELGRTVTEAGNAIRIYFASAAEANKVARGTPT